MDVKGSGPFGEYAIEEFTEDDAKEAIKVAEQVIDFVRVKILV
ncbi:MAG: hypothetical protein QMD66_01230 [Actinomycetota bacterium]|nr:hypothetical protein [Actinomycetota bacterium]MDI6821493.1 hypothetical protein [Actinomycetota bacterium]